MSKDNFSTPLTAFFVRQGSPVTSGCPTFPSATFGSLQYVCCPDQGINTVTEEDKHSTDEGRHSAGKGNYNTDKVKQSTDEGKPVLWCPDKGINTITDKGKHSTDRGKHSTDKGMLTVNTVGDKGTPQPSLSPLQFRPQSYN